MNSILSLRAFVKTAYKFVLKYRKVAHIYGVALVFSYAKKSVRKHLNIKKIAY